MSKKTEKIFLIDGNSFCYRAFYAIQALSTSKGMPTNAIYGFINMLKKLKNEHNPAMMAMVFDLKGPTTRHKKYKEYKIQRKPMPDELVVQLPRIKDVVSANNIPIYEMKGFEADDIIATLADKAGKKGFEVVIVTGDKDALQLVGDRIKVLSPHSKEGKTFDSGEVRKKFGVLPGSMPELMALMGDASDNIPGVRGIGPVTARKLIEKFGNIDNLYENMDKVKPESVRSKLAEDEKMARLSRDLAVLDRDLPVEPDVKKMRLGEPDYQKLSELYREFEFQSLLREITPSETGDADYCAMDTDKKISEEIQNIKNKPVLALKIVRASGGEGLDGISFSYAEGAAGYIKLGENKKGKRSVLKKIKDVLEDKNIKKIGYDFKEDLLSLEPYGIDVKGIGFDIMLADYLLEPSLAGHDLEGIVMRHLGRNMISSGGGKNIKWDGNGQATMDLAGAGSYYAPCERADMIFRLYPVLENELKKKRLKDLFDEVEMPLLKVLARMESSGVSVDMKYIRKMALSLEKKLKTVTKKIYKLAGEEFNVNSPKQLQKILFEKLELPSFKKTKTGASTDEAVLLKLSGYHELPSSILEYREINKLKTTYYDSIIALTDERTNKLHTHFNQAITSTGRLSSSEPNLQNIPVRTELGRAVRKAFIADDDKSILLAADYSQVELRVLAHLSGDKSLMEAFTGGEDVHKYTASLIFDADLEEVDREMRAVAKTVNFGIIYGMGPFRLAKYLDITLQEAQRFIDSYFERYSGVRAFIDKTLDFARRKGYVTTLLNRRRYIPEITSSNVHVRSFAERAAMNTPVQGSAADLIKLAMLELYRKGPDKTGTMILQVHDELIFNIPADGLLEKAKEVKNTMERVMELGVPLKVDVESGRNWLEMEKVKF